MILTIKIDLSLEHFQPHPSARAATLIAKFFGPHGENAELGTVTLRPEEGA